MCLMPSNPDIAGIGVRIAIYLQNLLCFIPAVWAIWDWEVTDYELESAETQSTTNLVLAFAILISCIAQAFTLGLTSYHATIVLSLSWMNNTNAFIYFLLYVHYKCQGVKPQVKPEWSSWIDHVKGHIRGLFRLPAVFRTTAPYIQAASDGPEATTDGREQTRVTGGDYKASPQAKQTGIKDAKAGVKVLFKRIAILLGSLHLTLMSALGIWLWTNPRSFGSPEDSCAVDVVHLAVVGARVPFGSESLRIISLVIYSLFLLPGLNLLLPMAAFLGLYIWHHARLAKKEAPAAETTLETATQTELSVKSRIAVMYRATIDSPVLAISVGLGVLFAINIVFIADIELTLHRNQEFQDNQETEWGFGQILAMLLVFLPLRDVVEMILARRMRRQEEQIKRHELTAAWKSAILARDVEAILGLVPKGVDPNIRLEDGWTALEVATVAQDGNAVRLLANATPRPANVDIIFHDGRTAVQVAALSQDRETLNVLVGAQADCVNTINGDGMAALEVATQKTGWSAVEDLVTAGADTNVTFQDGQTVLERAANAGEWGVVQRLANVATDLNIIFKTSSEWDGYGCALQAACAAGNFEVVESLLENGADPNLQGGEHGSAIQAACVKGRLDIAGLLLNKGADPNSQGGRYGCALQAVCAEDKLDSANWLLAHGADPNLQGGYLGSALQAACERGTIDLVGLLLNKGADPNLQGGEYGFAPLHAACSRNALDIVKMLLEKGADPNVQSWAKKESALQTVSELGRLEMATLLLEKGADPNLKGGPYGTALHAACANVPQIRSVQLLLEHGADPNIPVDSDGLTVLQKLPAMKRAWFKNSFGTLIFDEIAALLRQLEHWIRTEVWTTPWRLWPRVEVKVVVMSW